MKGNHEALLQSPFRQLISREDASEFIKAGILSKNPLYLEVLPVATVVADELLLVHGRLPRIEDLENARKILSVAREQSVLEEILWNDLERLDRAILGKISQISESTLESESPTPGLGR